MRKALVITILMLCGCNKSVVIEMPRTKADTTIYTPRQVDTLELSDVPIVFEVGIAAWEEDEIEINF